MSGVTCPYLGIADDAETALAYPSPWNCCFRQGAPVSVALEHQRSYCLATAYVGCPIYLNNREETNSVQQGVVLKEQKRIVQSLEKDKNPKLSGLPKLSAKKLVMAISVLLMLVFLIWGVVWGKDLLADEWLFAQKGLEKNVISTPILAKNTITATKTPVIISPTSGVVVISEPMPTASATLTVAALTKTVTFTPTSTRKVKETKNTQKEATSTSAPVSTASCGAPAGWVLYTVKQGDTLSGLSRVLGVSVAQLQTANCMGVSTQLYAGTSIYVPFYPPVVKTVIPTNTALPPTKTPVPATKTSLPPTKTTAPTATLFPASSTPIPTETIFVPTATQEIIATTETIETTLQ